MNDAFQEFNCIEGLIDSAYHKAARKMGLSDSELDILYVLATHRPSCLQSTLCQQTHLTKSTVNSSIKKMEKAGILYLTPGPGKNTCVHLTKQGSALVSRTADRLIEIEKQIYSSWTEEELSLFLHLNRDFAEKMHKMLDAL